MVKLISEEILPKNKRASASKEEVLSCLEQLEEKVQEMMEDPTYDAFDALKVFMKSMNKSIRDLKPTIASEEKDIDRVLKYSVDLKKTMEGLLFCREQSIEKIKAEEKKKELNNIGVEE